VSEKATAVTFSELASVRELQVGPVGLERQAIEVSQVDPLTPRSLSCSLSTNPLIPAIEVHPESE